METNDVCQILSKNKDDMKIEKDVSFEMIKVDAPELRGLKIMGKIEITPKKKSSSNSQKNTPPRRKRKRRNLKNAEKKGEIRDPTDHAYKRAKERLKWSRRTLDRMVKRAYLKGIKCADTKGRLNRYIKQLHFKNGVANNMRIYGQNIFLFKDDLLITLYRMPNSLIRYLKVVNC